MSTSVLSLDTAARTSSTISIPEDTTYNFVLYGEEGVDMPAQGGGAIYLETPGAPVPIAELDAEHSFSASIRGPVDIVIKVPASRVQLGVHQYP